jgi:integrase/recombinase XerC
MLEGIGNDLTRYVEMENVKESFINYLDVDDLTLKTYKTGIESFINYLKGNNIVNPTRDDVIAYRNMLRETYSNNTVNTYMIAIRALFKYLEIHRLYENICVDIKGAKYSTTPKKQVLTLEQAQKIYKGLTDKKEKALFSLLISTGCRGIEVANARIEDIKEHNNETVLWIKCKKHLERDEYVKLSDQVMKDIKNYIGDRTSGYIFISTSNNNNGGGLTTTSLRTTIKNIFRRFGLEQDTFSLHSTRRSCATFMYENGADIHSIQQVLHHVSENTTVRYINAVTRDNNKNEYLVSNAIFG